MTNLQELAISAIIALALVTGGGVLGYKKATSKYAPELESAQKDLTDARAAVLMLQQDISAQNAAILQLKQAGEERLAQAQAVILKAQQQAHEADQAAQKILTSRPPQGVDTCKAARDAFDEELKQERGVK